MLAPLLPSALMVACSVAILALTLVSWCHSDARLATWADVQLDRHGSRITTAVTFLAACLAAVYLETGILTGGFCTAPDEHVLGILRRADWSEAAGRGQARERIHRWNRNPRPQPQKFVNWSL